MVPIAGPASRTTAHYAGRRNVATRPGALSVDGAEVSRALIAVQPIARRDHIPVHRRPAAGFLAQLIATEQHMAQTRERRRAEPGEAITAYALAATMPPGRRTPFVRSV